MTRRGAISKEADATEKKRVLVVVRWPVGGIRTFMRYVYRRFAPERYHFTILAPENPELDILAHDLEMLDLEIIRVSEFPSAAELFAAAAKLLLLRKFDLVHSQGFTSGICTALPAFLSGTPHILTSHDMLFAGQFKGWEGRLKKLVMRATLSLVTSVHLISNDAKANLLQFFPYLEKKEGKCFVILNGIETERFLDAVPLDLRQEHGIGEGVFLVGFLGRFMSPKGFIYLANAIDLLREKGMTPERLQVLTFGEGAFIREERAALADRGLQGFFRFLPFTANVAGAIKGLDLVVSPSVWETCPLLPMEVLVAGTPLLASNCIGLREVAADTPTHMVPSRDGRALAEEIELFMNHDLRQPFRDFVPEAVKRYDVSSAVTALQSVILERMR